MTLFIRHMPPRLKVFLFTCHIDNNPHNTLEMLLKHKVIGMHLSCRNSLYINFNNFTLAFFSFFVCIDICSTKDKCI